MKIRSTLLSLIAAIWLLPSVAQTTSGALSLKGSVTDSVSHKPVEFATLTLKNAAKQPVKSTLTKTNGNFIFEKLTPGKYNLVLVSVGYVTRQVPVELTDNPSKIVDLGGIAFTPNSKQLKAVNINADKPVVSQQADRLVYDLQADPESKVYSVLEMMRKVPMLSLDGDDNIKLKGNDNYKILINGKPSSMVARNPKDVLRAMPASSIDRIEVITTPPAKYDAEGLVGIINIVTHKTIDNGYNGSVNISGRFPVGGPGLGGSLTLKQGKFGLFVQSGGNTYNSPEAGNSLNRLTTGTDPTNLLQNGSQSSDSRSGYFGTELSYEIDTLNLIAGNFNINGNSSYRTSDQSSLLTGSTGVLQGYNLGNISNGNGHGMDAAINYQLGFKHSKIQLLTFSYRYLRSEDITYSNLLVINPVNYTQPNYHQNNDALSKEQTLQVDYTHPFSKKLTMDVGVKAIWRNNNSDFEYLSQSGSGEFVTDPLRSNLFDNTQNIYGAYNSYQYTLKDWDFKGGIRIEETDFNGAGISRTYFNVVPSISVNRKFKNNTGINFGFSQRIQRPGINQLNPFVDRSNPNFYSGGNPALNPTTANSYSVGFNSSKKVQLNVNLGYIGFRNLIMPGVTYDPATHVVINILQNTGKAQLFTFSSNVNYNITPKWSLSANANVAHGHVVAVVSGQPLENQGFMENGYLSTNYRFASGMRLGATLNVSGPDLSLQGTSNWNINSSFSVGKDIVKNRLSFSFVTNNPFAQFRNYQREFFGPDFDQFTTRQNFYRSFNCSLNYRFGKLKDNLKKAKKGIQNDDGVN
ncbi:TonB-dependent receptor [Mucilaginibacter sp. PPCGB 2223]|uniref:outer membrane beta-barrel family protein n=1 Tax=Mucilaginibacter sp. PPCGB 2223 TaxID=1886027 RepID=UPI0008245351|nr:outer membrane beta-barrel family protein [Mucilaginibacter sp. PPCGB 2223]OCX52729.1 TonB-dependent receptor [Mucilaginibacter sp. PPCGB 2223]